MKKIKEILFIITFLLMVLLCTNVNAASDFDLKQLDFQATLNEDGSMKVTEKWQIDINDTTNTLFKTFETDDKKYNSITDVRVKDVTANKNLEEINQLMYHVKTDCYYGMENDDGDFEIAWGINRSSGRRTYEISYIVNNVISVYNDCAELYWQFIGSSFKVSAENVTGTIKLPKSVEILDNLRVWAHGPLNGEINATSNDTVKFEISPFIANTYVEVRLAILEPEMFNLSKKTINTNKLNSIISEETQWADEANAERELIKKNQNRIKWFGIIASVGIAVFFISKFMKNIKTIKETPRPMPTTEIEYFREIPNEHANPGNASFLYYFNKTSMSMVMPKILSATMLDLALKKYIEFEVDTTKRKNEQVTIKLLDKDISDLRESEKTIYSLLKRIGKIFTMKEFEKYAQKHNNIFLGILNKIAEQAEKENVEDKNYDKELRKIHDKYQCFGIAAFVVLVTIAIIWLGVLEQRFIPVIVATIPAVIYAFTCFDIAGRVPRTYSKGNR